MTVGMEVYYTWHIILVHSYMGPTQLGNAHVWKIQAKTAHRKLKDRNVK